MLNVVILCDLLLVIYGGKIFWGLAKQLSCSDANLHSYFSAEEFSEIPYCYKDNLVCNPHE